jgi:hypothetical protein
MKLKVYIIKYNYNKKIIDLICMEKYNDLVFCCGQTSQARSIYPLPIQSL